MVYCKGISEVVCDLIVDGYCLRAIGAVKGLPSKATIMRWLNDRRKTEFHESYRRAKEVQRWALGDEYMDYCQQGYSPRSLGALGDRIGKLALKKHHTPRKLTLLEKLEEEIKRRALLAD